MIVTGVTYPRNHRPCYKFWLGKQLADHKLFQSRPIKDGKGGTIDTNHLFPLEIV